MGDTVTITRLEYERLLEAADDLAGYLACHRSLADIAAGWEERIPSELVDRMIDGESPLRIYREYRGLTQTALSKASGVNRTQIADIESRRRSGSVDTVRKLAEALRLTIDDLV